MSPKTKAVPNEVFSKKLLSLFKPRADISKSPKQFHAQVLELMFEREMDVQLGYDKNYEIRHNSGNSRNRTYPKEIQTEMDSWSYPYFVTATANLNLLQYLNIFY